MLMRHPLIFSAVTFVSQLAFAADPPPVAPAPSSDLAEPPAEEPAEVPAEEPATEPAAQEPAPEVEAAPPPEEPPPVAETVAEPPPEPLELAPSEEAPAKPKKDAGIFGQGRIRIGGSVGFSTAIGGASNQSWFILGVGAGAFVLDGLELHADSTFWMGDPFLATLTPGVRYVFWMVPVVKPYVGTFYRHYFVTGVLSDSDSLGARAGINVMMSDRAYLGGGVIYEHFLDAALFTEPDQFYPEITIALAF